jgi:hypothetical protein
MQVLTRRDVEKLVQELSQKLDKNRHSYAGSVEIRGSVYAIDDKSITLVSGELIVSIRIEEDLVGIVARLEDDGKPEVEVRVRPDARVIMETSVEPGLVKGLITGEVFMEVMKPGMRTFGWCDTHWCCRGACWCGIGECGAAEADYIPGTKFRQTINIPTESIQQFVT